MIRNIFGFKGVSYIYIHCFITKYAKKGVVENAKHGFSFLVKMGYAGDGRWNMYWTEKGMFWKVQSQYFSDFHVLQGGGRIP